VRRINITKELREKVEKFNATLFTGRKKSFIHPKLLLKRLRLRKDKEEFFGLPESKIEQYVKKIEDEYLIILNADSKTAERLITEFEKLISADEMTTALHESITTAMRYTDLREKEFIAFLSDLNIKACVYCHSQSTLVISQEGGTKWRALLQLDHKYPKSKYPFLSTSFYNLYPICANCNLSKGDRPTEFELYVDHFDLDVFGFGLEKKSILRYWKAKNIDEIQIEIRGNNISKKSLHEYQTMFNIQPIYDQHKDIAEELLHKLEVYNDAYKTTLKEEFSKLFPDKTMINRLIIGNYDKSADMLKRPMAKFVQEIARDIKLIPKE